MAMSLPRFLARARAALAAPAAEGSPLTFVVGNESADIDSLCSALVLAYLRTHAPPGTLHIPLSNLPRSDLVLRTEMAAVLGHAGLAPSDLLTLSELPDQLRPEDTRWLLVDHNALTGPLRRFAPSVTGCIDHHEDEMVVPSDASPRIIETSGSCMSLVIEESRHLWEELASREDAVAAEEARLAQLGLAAILIDTINLTAEDKIRDKDRRAASFLETKLAGLAGYDRAAYFQQISSVKEDISQLGFRDILRKDYKEWEEAGLKLGISSVVQGLDYLVDVKAGGSAENFIAAVDSWAEERGLDVVSIMTTSHPGGEFQRHLFVRGRTGGGAAVLAEFTALAAGQLQLEPYAGGRLDDGAGQRMAAWRQRNLRASRKQVAPLFREALEKTRTRSKA